MSLRACQLLTGFVVPCRCRRHIGFFCESPGSRDAIKVNVSCLPPRPVQYASTLCSYEHSGAHVAPAPAWASVADPARTVSHRRVVWRILLLDELLTLFGNKPCLCRARNWLVPAQGTCWPPHECCRLIYSLWCWAKSLMGPDCLWPINKNLEARSGLPVYSGINCDLKVILVVTLDWMLWRIFPITLLMSLHVIINFLVALIRNMTRSNIREKKIILVHSLKHVCHGSRNA